MRQTRLLWLLLTAVGCGAPGASLGEQPAGEAAEASSVPDPTVGDANAPVATTDPTPPATSTPVALCTPDTYTSYAKGFFASNCTSCHTYDHTAFAAYAGVKADSSNITSRIMSGSMPRMATLPTTEQKRILAWLNCKLPQ